jgi:hypothetical integral membrane protein (TIGR02206 family)
LDAFRPFSLTHAAALLGIAALIWLVVVVGRRQRDDAAPTRFENSLAVANLVFWFAAHGYWNTPPQFDPVKTLPLQLCHLVSLGASFVLLTRLRWLRALLYFWGIGLATQALITPGLTDPPTTIWFWAFWFQHGFIQLAAVYDLAVLRYRPAWRDYGFACLAALAYVAVVLPLDLALGANYGFVGDSKPDSPSIVDLLGPWPGRLVFIVVMVAAVMALLMLPWRHAAGRPGKLEHQE